ncbi:hypothetical protein [Mesorhizobium sp. M0959]|uniref:hypothetical protein n=1 Tax=unclassified Mesorhizobium TaxID=325217 RepID=UPI00333919D1
MPTLYLALDNDGREGGKSGFAYRIDPCVLCSYEIDCDDVVDLRTAQGQADAEIRFEDIACAETAEVGGERP